MADTQISTTGGDVAERTSLQNGGGSAVTESLLVEDTAEQFSVDEEEEVADDPLHYEDPVMHISGAGTLVPGGLDRRPFGGVSGRFGIIGDGDFGCPVRKSSAGRCAGGCTSDYSSDVAQCEWDRH